MSIEIDHVGLGVSDYEAAKTFYSAALAPLGITLLRDYPSSVTGGDAAGGFGIGSKPFFWLSGGGKANTPPLHLAFRAENRGQVDAFYDAALRAGGGTTASRASGRSITRTTTARSCSTSTATT